MKTEDDVESYLIQSNMPYERLRPGIWNIKVADAENLLVSVAGPVVVFRMKVMEIPARGREGFFETLLRLNTTDMVHGAFGLEDASVVIGATLALENVDRNEFQSVVDDITLAVSKLYPQLSKFRNGPDHRATTV